MARLGKTSDSLSKSASKKAKCAATTAKQDLEEDFASEIPKTAQLDPIAVDASPAQIPRKTKVVPASSLGPPSHTAEDTQDRSCEPPDTVTIPSRSSAPPPIQDSARYALSIPTIRSRMNHEAIPIQYVYLLDVEDCSSEDDLRSHVILLSENRRQRRRLVRKIKELNVKEDSKKAKKYEEQYRMDALNQKKLCQSLRPKTPT